MTPRAFLTLAACAAALLPASAAHAAAPIGFKVTIPEGQQIECSYAAGELTCLNYTREGGKVCDFGGPVPGVVLKTTGKPKAKDFCVDEAYHGWKRLKKGKTWSYGAFKCRVNRADELRCKNRSGTHTIYEPGGLV